MKLALGDLWEHPAQYRLVTTNAVVSHGHLVMGAGVALQAKQRYPGLTKVLGDYVERYGNIPGRLDWCGIITFPTKHHWKNPSDLELIAQSAKYIASIVKEVGIRSVVSPPPGCGNGGLTWAQVFPVINPIFDDRFTIVFERRLP